MFGKNDNDFDDVNNYKRNREYDGADNYFSRDDEYMKTNENSDIDNNQNYDSNGYDTNKRFKPRNSGQAKKKRSPIVRIILAVAIMLVVFTAVRGIVSNVGNIGTGGDESGIQALSDFDEYIAKEQQDYAKTFAQKYEKAKKNRVKYDRLKKSYISGDYSNYYVVNERYLVNFNVIDESITDAEYDYEKKVNLDCLKDREDGTDYETDEKITGEFLSCGIMADEKRKYPMDFVEYKKEELYDYSKYKTETMDRYYIDGYFYTKEYCDEIVDFAKKLK